METIVYSYKKLMKSFVGAESFSEKSKLLLVVIFAFPLLFVLWVFSSLLTIVSKKH